MAWYGGGRDDSRNGENEGQEWSMMRFLDCCRTYTPFLPVGLGTVVEVTTISHISQLLVRNSNCKSVQKSVLGS